MKLRSPFRSLPSPRATLVGFLLLSGCVPDFDDDLSRIESPRLVALVPTPAEAKEGDTVSLEAVIATPEGETAHPPRLSLCLARKPLAELGPVNPACLEADDGSGQVQQALGQALRVSATLPQGACKLFGPERPPAMGNDPGGRPVDPDVTGGFYQPFVAHLAGSTSLGALRLDCGLANANRDQTLAYRAAYRANEAPRIATLAARERGSGNFHALAEELVEVRGGDALALRATWDDCKDEAECGDGLCTAGEDRANCLEDCMVPRGCSGAEPYVWYDAVSERVEPRREGISVAWYASRGHFDHEQTGVEEAESVSQHGAGSEWSVPTAPGPATVWAVIRDTRGGLGVRIQPFVVVP